MLFSLGRYADGLEVFEDIVNQKGSEATEFQLLKLARCQQKLNQHQAAVLSFVEALKKRELSKRPYGEDAYLHMRVSLLALGRIEEAKNAYSLWVEESYLRDRQRKIIYCPIPKNACTYLKTALVLNSFRGHEFDVKTDDAHLFTRKHNSGLHLQNASLIQHQHYFSFTVLRDPYSRLASAYANVFVRPLTWRKIPDQAAHAAVFNAQSHNKRRLDLRRSICFEDFVHYLCRTPDEELDYHWRPQSHFFTDIEAFDMTAAFENITPLIRALEHRGWNFSSIEPSNKTIYRSHPDSENFHEASPQTLSQLEGFPGPDQLFSPELCALVRKRYARDFSLYEKHFGEIRDPMGNILVYPTGGALAAHRDDKQPHVVAVPPMRTIPTENTPTKKTPDNEIILYAAPDGEPAANGDKASPMGLQAALQGAVKLQERGIPVRVKLASGLYRSTCEISASSTSGSPLIIEAEAPGEAIISGSDRWSKWEKVGDLWQAQWPHRWGLSSVPDDYDDPYLRIPELMRRREMVFVNGQQFRQVLTAAELQTGCYCIDETEHLLVIYPHNGCKLSDAKIDVAVRSTLLRITNIKNLTISGLRFIHDATAYFTPQSGALHLSNCRDTRIENCSFEWNNNKGLQLDGPRTARVTLKQLRSNENGCLGLLASRVKGLFFGRL